ncbi:MAG TPA: S41 family peptidase, partial [Vicinamibacterales bacterium]
AALRLWGDVVTGRAGTGLLLAAFVWIASPSAAQTAASCTPTGKNLFVRDVMTDLYLWYTEIPALDPSRFPSPEAYLDAIRYRPLDSSYSYIADRASTEAFFASSQYAGFGFSSALDAALALRVVQVYPASPADEAGLLRGDRIVEINGRSVDELLATDALGAAYGPPEAGVPGELVVRRGEDTLRASMVKRPVIIPTVSHTTVFDVGGQRVGYVFFRNFVEPSFGALAEAFEVLRSGGARELVLDLRYNGGGLVNVAQFLGGLIGGARTEGQVFAEYFHNDRNAFRNQILRFDTQPAALPLERLVVITTQASASASELVINALRPFIPVVIVGDRTYGKPVGQYAIPFCDKILAPVSFQLRNANGEGDFFDGLPPTCPAPDDFDAQLGDPTEGSLREALTVIATGACSSPPSTTARTQRQRQRTSPRATGWDAVLGAN